MTSEATIGDDSGWLPGVRREASPNYDERPEAGSIRLVVIHAISLPPGEFGGTAILELFKNRLDPNTHPYFREIQGLRVSAHFLIRRDGELIQLVSCAKRAWHAGTSMWSGQENCNNFSIGIELEGCDQCPFDESQYMVLRMLVVELRKRYAIEAIVGHSDIAPDRKTDPGPFFDWSLLDGETEICR